MLESCLAQLNGLDIFKGVLKIGTLKDRWRKADSEKAAEDIISNEDKFVKPELLQNRGQDMGEIDCLYYHLAKRMKSHSDSRQHEKEQTAAEKRDLQHRLTAES